MRPGDLAPDFTLTADDGSVITLSEQLAAGPVVLFFYPKAMTPGCTAESCHFRDLATEFADVGAQRLGVSADSVDQQHRFSEKHSFDYPLLSDADKAVAGLYGVKRLGPLMNKRMTFVIDTDRTLLDVIASEMNMNRHADEALAVLQRRATAMRQRQDEESGG
jgi:thioredoxin-dependent peroxiredoxin